MALPSPHDSEVEEIWQCPRCTLENKAEDNICDACMYDKRGRSVGMRKARSQSDVPARKGEDDSQSISRKLSRGPNKSKRKAATGLDNDTLADHTAVPTPKFISTSASALMSTSAETLMHSKMGVNTGGNAVGRVNDDSADVETKASKKKKDKRERLHSHSHSHSHTHVGSSTVTAQVQTPLHSPTRKRYKKETKDGKGKNDITGGSARQTRVKDTDVKVKSGVGRSASDVSGNGLSMREKLRMLQRRKTEESISLRTTPTTCSPGSTHTPIPTPTTSQIQTQNQTVQTPFVINPDDIGSAPKICSDGSDVCDTFKKNTGKLGQNVLKKEFMTSDGISGVSASLKTKLPRSIRILSPKPVGVEKSRDKTNRQDIPSAPIPRPTVVKKEEQEQLSTRTNVKQQDSTQVCTSEENVSVNSELASTYRANGVAIRENGKMGNIACPYSPNDLLGWTKLRDGVYLEVCSQGGGRILHVFLSPAIRDSDANTQRDFVEYVIEETFRETEDEVADNVITIVHGGGYGMPDILRTIADHHPTMKVIVEEFGKAGYKHENISDYVERVGRTFVNNTHQAGAMRNISLVGTVQEETGGFFPDIIKQLTANIFLAPTLPWGRFSSLAGMDPTSSDDGPILWTRNGEHYYRVGETHTRAQIHSRSLPATAATSPVTSPSMKSHADTPPITQSHASIIPTRVSGSRGGNTLGMFPARIKSSREKLYTDRTTVHADFSGRIPFRLPVAAVGLLQSASDPICTYNAGSKAVSENSGAVCKEVVAFSARHMALLERECRIDFNEEPMDQSIDSSYWVDTARLNQLRKLGVTYATAQLRTGDIYFIPRKIVHQFHTVGGCSSVAWHFRYKKYAEFIENMNNASAMNER
eukprot:CFRG5807T1